jgi:hypothetical protein
MSSTGTNDIEVEELVRELMSKELLEGSTTTSFGV